MNNKQRKKKTAKWKLKNDIVFNLNITNQSTGKESFESTVVVAILFPLLCIKFSGCISGFYDWSGFSKDEAGLIACDKV